ncbi:MAG TPA: hypothetical protein VK421_14275 [Pyrinomonadaceae bacterium]|nr:hypothetical protein [Pyrinomonadaceae bacterium]
MVLQPAKADVPKSYPGGCHRPRVSRRRAAKSSADAALTHGRFTPRRQPPVTVKNRVRPAEIFEVDWRGEAA